MAGSLFVTHVEDQRYALTLVQLLTRSDQPQPSVYLVHQGIPIPKGRPRFTKQGRAYTPKRTREAEWDLAWSLKAAVKSRPMVGPLVMVALFYVPDQRRADVDNWMKLVNDAGNEAGIWHDDSQVVACAARVDLDPACPRTVIAIASAASGLHRMPSKKQKEIAR